MAGGAGLDGVELVSMRRFLVVVALAMLIGTRLGVHVPRLAPMLPKEITQHGTSELKQTAKAFKALPRMQECLDAVGNDTEEHVVVDACGAFQRALE